MTFDEAAFLNSAPLVTTETFNEYPSPTEFPPDQLRIVSKSIRFRSVDPSPEPGWIIDLDGFPNPDNVLFRHFAVNGFEGTGQLAIAFRDGHSVPAVGFRLQAFGTPNQIELLVTETDGAVTSFFLPRDMYELYIGLTSPNGIKRVLIRQHPELTAGGMSNFSLDDVSRGQLSTTR